MMMPQEQTRLNVLAHKWVVVGGLVTLLVSFVALRLWLVDVYAGPFLLGIAMLYLMLAWLVQRIRAGRFDWFEPINWFFVSLGVGFGLRSLYIALGVYNRHTTFTDEAEFIFYVNLAMVYGLAALVAYLVGYTLWRQARQLAGRLPVFQPVVRPRPFYAALFILTVAGLLALAILVRESGISLNNLSLASLSRKRHYIQTGYYLKSVPFFLFAAVAMMGVWHFTVRRSWWLWVWVALAAAWPFFSSTRESLLGVLLLPIIMRSYLVKPISGRTMATLAISFAFLLSVLVAIRQANYRGDEIVESSTTLTGVLDNTIGSRSFADVVTFAHVIRAVPDEIPLQLGATYARLLAGPIPRSLWPDKPLPIGKELGQLFYEQAGAVPPSMAAEAYMNFHLPGVVLVFVVFGLASRTLYEYLRLNDRNPYAVAIYAFSVIFVFKYSNSDFVINSQQFLMRTLPLLLGLYIMSGGFQRRPQATDTPPSEAEIVAR